MTAPILSEIAKLKDLDFGNDFDEGMVKAFKGIELKLGKTILDRFDEIPPEKWSTTLNAINKIRTAMEGKPSDIKETRHVIEERKGSEIIDILSKPKQKIIDVSLQPEES
jgi:hypothetical protein